MKRDFLFSFYETPHGKLLQQLEIDYLKHAITVSCKQTILQLGYLGWENEFIDCGFFYKYCILDAHGKGCVDAVKIISQLHSLPIQSETVDLIIVPHVLEFDVNHLQTMREIERVLKPEGEVIILNLNPLSIWVYLQLLWNIKTADSWKGHFIARNRILDWLRLLNFEIKTTTKFTVGNMVTVSKKFKFGKRTFFSIAYAVRAVKRQYTLIPLTPIKSRSFQLVNASSSRLKTALPNAKQYD